MCVSAAQGRHHCLLSGLLDHLWIDMYKIWETGHSNITGISGGQTCILPAFSEFSRSERHFILIWLIADYSPTVCLGSTKYFFVWKKNLWSVASMDSSWWELSETVLIIEKFWKLMEIWGFMSPGYEGETGGNVSPKIHVTSFLPPQTLFFLSNSSSYTRWKRKYFKKLHEKNQRHGG